MPDIQPPAPATALPHLATETLTQDQLDALVKLHERFLDGRIGGRRAILKRVDLTGLSLARTNMRQADFSGCVMR